MRLTQTERDFFFGCSLMGYGLLLLTVTMLSGCAGGSIFTWDRIDLNEGSGQGEDLDGDGKAGDLHVIPAQLPLTVYIDPSTPPVMASRIGDAIDAINEVAVTSGGPIIFARTQGRGFVTVYYENPYRSDWYAMTQAPYNTNNGVILRCNVYLGPNLAAQPDTIWSVSTHELLHCLGLAHGPDRYDELMSAERGLTTTRFTDYDVQAISWVASGYPSYSARASDAEDPLIGNVPSKED